jgi:hypothetical protein
MRSVVVSASAITNQSEDFCEHTLCYPCWQEYLRKEVVEKEKRASPFLLTCPVKTCRKKLGVDNIVKLADPSTLRVIDELRKTIPRVHPTHLSDFSYTFSADGKLVNAETGGKFHFVTQTHYDALGDLVAPYIQDLMLKRLGYV